MSGVRTKLSYKQLNTLKHALLKHMQRDGITDNDIQSEQALLLKINYQIKKMKELYNI
ncbi:hypothetical protein CHCC15325_3066 [Bacillus licheniformis]|uniref:DNA strand exchange inhibitor protein n=1 Tax=Bacillus licheniformis TaxID=1402 RepID=UPI0011A973CF|nr:DNA strand exchange inhibitor protein [Bacillus licheniformis]TWL55398.1 hypothetical protein CHCC15325_3066 [Bacillus licheniformis]